MGFYNLQDCFHNLMWLLGTCICKILFGFFFPWHFKNFKGWKEKDVIVSPWMIFFIYLNPAVACSKTKCCTPVTTTLQKSVRVEHMSYSTWMKLVCTLDFFMHLNFLSISITVLTSVFMMECLYVILIYIE